MKEKQMAADQFVAGKKAPKMDGEVTYTTVFTFILRLRQCCVLPHLIHSVSQIWQQHLLLFWAHNSYKGYFSSLIMNISFKMIEEDGMDEEADMDDSQLPEDEVISLRNPVFASTFASAKIARVKRGPHF